jgi:hypothetical protein
VIRVVEDERDGVIVCPNGVAGETVNVSDAMLGSGASGESGFAGAGRAHTERPFILSSF